MVFVEDKDQKVRTDKTETRSCICGGLGQKYHIIYRVQLEKQTGAYKDLPDTKTVDDTW